jgi:hypothetical protein
LDRLIEDLRAIDPTLATLDVEYSEWEVLYRMRLQIERDLLVGSSVGQGLQPPARHRRDRGRVAPGLRGASW